MLCCVSSCECVCVMCVCNMCVCNVLWSAGIEEKRDVAHSVPLYCCYYHICYCCCSVTTANIRAVASSICVPQISRRKVDLFHPAGFFEHLVAASLLWLPAGRLLFFFFLSPSEIILGVLDPSIQRVVQHASRPLSIVSVTPFLSLYRTLVSFLWWIPHCAFSYIGPCVFLSIFRSKAARAVPSRTLSKPRLHITGYFWLWFCVFLF